MKTENDQILVISMTKRDLDDYIDKYLRAKPLYSKEEKGEKLSQKQAAALFGVTTVTIIRWQKKGIIPFNKVGRTVFYYKSELLKIAQVTPELLK
ncbi:DNA-binding protein [Rufibacter immobilis]|uniref:DNA-binding protein n=1 Tax=Rufibacter immobilis TaxID=1348778 RepID=A0A3M9MRJ9_9BACT|nr:helix-turn-helix domain-containing protein [Rufibacter immobilis]RNI28164.1 DNA-binding protein [Rufibacter immobilis]